MLCRDDRPRAPTSHVERATRTQWRALQTTPARRAFLLAGLAVAVGLGAWLIHKGGDFGRVPWWVWVLFPLFLCTAGIQCLRTARRLSDSDRKIWTCFGVGLLAEATGEAMWGIHDLSGGGPAPFPVIAYAAYFSYSILSIAGFWYCMPNARSARVPLVQLGNLATVVSAILLAYMFLFYGFLRSPFPIALSFIAIGYCILGLTAFLFGSIVASLRLSGRIRWVMFLVLIGVGTIAITDYHFTYIVLHAEYLKTDPLNITYLVASGFFVWAAFERNQLPAVPHASEAALRVDDRARLWETLLLPLAVAGVLVIALMFRERLTSDLLPYVAGASAFFVVSLALRNLWAQQLENRLRLQALASEAELQIANRELLNEMKSRSRAEEELRQSQKMEALGQLTGGVAHDFNNLLAVILGNLEMACQPSEPTERRRGFLEEAIDAANRGASLTQRLLALSRKQALRPESIDVGALLDAMRSLLERTLGEKIRIEICGPERPLHCLADAAQLESVLLNLAINARDAMPEGGSLAIAVSETEVEMAATSADEGAALDRFVLIAIRDTGVGIPEDAMGRVFDPFFTTKGVGKGTGLGLSMAYGFAKQSGGQIEIESALGEGTEVRLYLPRTDGSLPGLAADASAELPAGRGERILVVEDEPALRNFIVTLLEGLGYAVLAVAEGEAALEAAEANAPLDLLLSDVVLPGPLSGPLLANQILQRRPDVRVLFMSGYAEDVRAKEGPLWPGHELLHKPFHRHDLARAIRSTLDARG